MNNNNEYKMRNTILGMIQGIVHFLKNLILPNY